MNSKFISIKSKEGYSIVWKISGSLRRDAGKCKLRKPFVVLQLADTKAFSCFGLLKKTLKSTAYVLRFIHSTSSECVISYFLMS